MNEEYEEEYEELLDDDEDDEFNVDRQAPVAGFYYTSE
jgi:hypothetical protein